LVDNSQDPYNRDTQPIRRGQVENDLAIESAGAEFATVQDKIPTPKPIQPPSTRTPVDRTPARSSRGLRLAVTLALLLSVVSLALNGVLIYGLFHVRQTAADELDRAIAALDNLEGEGFHYDYRFQQTVPFSGDIPINQELVFPFEGDIPIKTTVQVPIDAGILGKFVIDVPIDTTFHVDLEVPVQIDQTVHVDTEIPLDMTIPIDISMDDPEVQKLLDQVRQVLLRLRDSF
jgi:hypothetical protein